MTLIFLRCSCECQYFRANVTKLKFAERICKHAAAVALTHLRRKVRACGRACTSNSVLMPRVVFAGCNRRAGGGGCCCSGAAAWAWRAELWW